MGSALQRFANLAPWALTSQAESVVAELATGLGEGYELTGAVAVHREARIEGGASIKGAAIIGPGCFVAAGALMRGGCWLEADCVVGPGVEVKSSFVFSGTKLAHFNFVGDSIPGRDVNLEAGAIIANRRNERDGCEIILHYRGQKIETGSHRFGALIGDRSRIGANAVIAPGAILAPGSVVERLALVDQSVASASSPPAG
ncbi:MAG: LpxA family transferase [Alphaproteobacteria bacterium]|nr:LpxA family transferase [Alphaproteobacteria bacterium]MBV9861783.1 LpxA family transferase [Alphaproteobacteria bacterium]